MWLFSLRLDFLLLSLRLLPVCLPLLLLPPQRRVAAGAQPEDVGKPCATPLPTGVRAPTTSSTSPQREDVGKFAVDAGIQLCSHVASQFRRPRPVEWSTHLCKTSIFCIDDAQPERATASSEVAVDWVVWLEHRPKTQHVVLH